MHWAGCARPLALPLGELARLKAVTERVPCSNQRTNAQICHCIRPLRLASLASSPIGGAKGGCAAGVALSYPLRRRWNHVVISMRWVGCAAVFFREKNNRANRSARHYPVLYTLIYTILPYILFSLILLSGGQAAADVALLFVIIQHLAGLEVQGVIVLFQAH